MGKKEKTFKIVRAVTIGLFMGYFIWLLCVGIGTLFDFGASNSTQSNFTAMSFAGALTGIVIGGTFTYVNVKRALKK